MLTQDTSINKISELYEKRNVFLFEIVSQIPAEEKNLLNYEWEVLLHQAFKHCYFLKSHNTLKT